MPRPKAPADFRATRSGVAKISNGSVCCRRQPRRAERPKAAGMGTEAVAQGSVAGRSVSEGR